MTRLIATYTLVPGRGLLKNHVTTLDDEGRFLSCLPLTKELPHTRFVSHTLALLPVDCAAAFEGLSDAILMQHIKDLPTIKTHTPILIKTFCVDWSKIEAE